MTTRIARKGTLTIAALIAALMIIGFGSTANAAPALDDDIQANVTLTIPGDYDNTPGQSWVWLYKVADHGTFDSTIKDALEGRNIGDPGGAHELSPVGNNLFRGSVSTGDYLVVAHLGPDTVVMSIIESIASGDQYGSGQTHNMTWSGAWDGTDASVTSGSGTTSNLVWREVTPTFDVSETITLTAAVELFEEGDTSYIDIDVFDGDDFVLLVPAVAGLDAIPHWVRNTEYSFWLVEHSEGDLEWRDVSSRRVALNIKGGVWDIFSTNDPDDEDEEITYRGRHIAETMSGISNASDSLTAEDEDDDAMYSTRQLVPKTGTATVVPPIVIALWLILGAAAAFLLWRKRQNIWVLARAINT